jgi:hypothetical protein
MSWSKIVSMKHKKENNKNNENEIDNLKNKEIVVYQHPATKILLVDKKINTCTDIGNTSLRLYKRLNSYQSRYTRRNVYLWLFTKIDNNFFNYDYCVILFEMLIKWVQYNKYSICIDENVLFAKFISLLYLLSKKEK